MIALLLPLFGRIPQAAAMDEIWQSELLFHVNAMRAASSLPPLAWNARLAQAAIAHAADLQRCNRLSHDGCDGSNLVLRLQRVAYRYRAGAENIALCPCDVAEVVRLWMQSEGHRRNLLHAGVTEMGAETRVDPTELRRSLWVLVLGRE